MQKNRLQYIDIAKGIGIILVVAGHLSFTKVIINIIYSFHMPLFFYLAGIFHKDNISLSDSFKKNLRFIYLYFLVGVFFIILFSIYSKNINFSLVVDLIRTTPVEIYNIPWYGISWFLLSFFIVKLLSTNKIFNSILFGLILFLCSFYINTYFDNLLLSLPLCIGPALMLLFFYNLGKYNTFFIDKFTIKNLIYVTFSFIFISSITYIFNDVQNLKLINYHHMSILYNPILSILISILGILFVIFLSILIEKHSSKMTNILSFFRQYSLFIFLSHLFCFFLLKKIMIILNIIIINSFIYNILLLILTIILISSSIFLYNKYFSNIKIKAIK